MANEYPFWKAHKTEFMKFFYEGAGQTPFYDFKSPTPGPTEHRPFRLVWLKHAGMPFRVEWGTGRTARRIYGHPDWTPDDLVMATERVRRFERDHDMPVL